MPGRRRPIQQRQDALVGVQPIFRLGTAIVLGSVLARWSDAVVVPPGKGHGKLHEQAYPKPLRPAGKGKDLLRHCRAGGDVSHHGETLYRRRERGRPA
jgi:hypothetical protein